jgi:hypothetical protein
MNDFQIEFQNRFLKYYNENAIDNRLKQILSLQGSHSSLHSVINECINVYALKFEDIKNKTPLELKHCLESYKLNKIGNSKRFKYKNVVLNIVNNSIKKFENNHIADFFVKHPNAAIDLKPHVKDSLPILYKHVEDIEFELDKIITDYNNNTTNYWGRNKDKIITPVIVSFVTTLVTLIITFIVTKYLLGWFK